MTRPPKTHRRWPTHALFDCQDCKKSWEDFTTAQAQASAHARRTGHRVYGEVGYAVRYNDPGSDRE